MSKGILVGLCTCPADETAERLARTLVAEKLAACVNVLPAATSIYEWRGEVAADPERLLVIKTREERWEALETRIRELHPHELPEVIAVRVEKGSGAYLDWVLEQTSA
ncbi:MAG: divalent-cation tolerance protein CutA [Gammaproteobacteria bacterium]|jgi:periplasmic divalent cation tolerance protein